MSYHSLQNTLPLKTCFQILSVPSLLILFWQDSISLVVQDSTSKVLDKLLVDSLIIRTSWHSFLFYSFHSTVFLPYYTSEQLVYSKPTGVLTETGYHIFTVTDNKTSRVHEEWQKKRRLDVNCCNVNHRECHRIEDPTNSILLYFTSRVDGILPVYYTYSLFRQQTSVTLKPRQWHRITLRKIKYIF